MKSVSLFFIITFKGLIRLSMYNTSLPNVWSPALNPHRNPIITHFNYRIIPVGYCIIIVANIINIQLIDTCITCFASQMPFHSPRRQIHGQRERECSYRKCLFKSRYCSESCAFRTSFGSQMSADGADKLTLEDNNCVFYFHVM